jgi:hypothetical protein
MIFRPIINMIIVGLVTINLLLMIPVDYVTYVPKNYIIPTSHYMYKNFLTYCEIFNQYILPYMPCVNDESYNNCVNTYTRLNQKYDEILPHIIHMSNKFLTLIELNVWPVLKNASFSTYQYIMVMIPYVMNYFYNIVATIMSQVVAKW